MAVYYLFTLRIFASLVCFFLAIQMARRISEAGKLSTITGMTLYLIGNGMFQWGNSNAIFFPSMVSGQQILLSISFFYYFAMGFFAMFSEMDENRNFSENLDTKFGKKFWKRYPWTLVSFIEMIIFVPLMLSNLLANYNYFMYGFLLLVIPFLMSNLKFLKRFSNLEILKEHKPLPYFVVGFILSGFANFLPLNPINLSNPDIYFLVSFYIQSVMVIVGALILVRGWTIIPPMIELKWYSKLQRLMVIQRQGSLVLYLYKFQVDSGEKDSHDVDGVLAGGAISGIQSLLGEILKSQEGINEIDQGDKTIYFQHSDTLTFVLFTNGKAKEFHEQLTQFAMNFNIQFADIVANWNGNLNTFDDADKIIKKTFIH